MYVGLSTQTYKKEKFKTSSNFSGSFNTKTRYNISRGNDDNDDDDDDVDTNNAER